MELNGQGRSVFLFGTLRHLPLLEVVLGHMPEVRPAELPGYGVVQASDKPFPMLEKREGATAQGLLLTNVSETDLARLDYYEQGYDYATRTIDVCSAGAQVEALVYFPPEGAFRSGGEWSLEAWVARHGDIATEAAREYMACFGAIPAEEAARRYPQMCQRAASRLRAGRESVPPVVRKGLASADVETIERRRPYSNFFTVDEHDLRFPLYGGGMSRPVTRAVLVGGDAVTVLPYDPERDRVLVIEQFRFGPYVRGDRYAWTLEPVAGRIDPGETPEQTARREMAEEAGVEIGDLHLVASYYPSPGTSTEYLFSYVGTADLPDGADGVHGLDHEEEDICSHVLPFGEALDLVQSGEADTGPLVMSLLWLAANRDRLRGLA